AGWRVLQQRGHAHGWIFIINRWDEGDPQQREDFARILRGAGFERPVLLCTSCAARAGGAASAPPDEFSHVRTTLLELLAAHGLRDLARLGETARLGALRAAVQHAARAYGDEQSWAALHEATDARWLDTMKSTFEGVQWPIRTVAARVAVRTPG